MISISPIVWPFEAALLPLPLFVRFPSFGKISSTGKPSAFASLWRVRYDGVRLPASMFEIVACATPVSFDNWIWDLSALTLKSLKRLILDHLDFYQIAYKSKVYSIYCRFKIIRF